ncbi:MAG: glycosyltransferase [Anaerolineae bacterium]
MSYATALGNEARTHIAEISAEVLADVILVGIPSYNSAATIGHVVRAASEGMVNYFPGLKPVLMNSDGGSSDGTREVVINTSVPEGVEVVVTQYQGLSGKGSAFRAIFEAAQMLRARVCVVVDSDLRSITPQWIELLAGPIVKGGYDYVIPYYSRHKYDGTITNNIVYPMTRMLYGLDIRQPIGGDFGFSAELARSYLDKDVWQTDVARFGIDIWMTTTAIVEGFRVCQAYLGTKVHDAKDPAATLGPMFVQVVGTLFRMMGLHEARWRGVEGSQPIPFYGKQKDVMPEPLTVTVTAMIDRLRAGATELREVWEAVLRPENLAAVDGTAALEYEEYDFAADLWAKIVFDFAVAYNRRGRAQSLPIDPKQVIEAMTPLYYGRTASLVMETKEMTSDEAEEVIRAQARTFERLKLYLVERWTERSVDKELSM